MSTIIGLSGKMGSGKDTLADLVLKLDPSFEKVSFAKKLKEVGAFLTNTNKELWFTQEGKNIYLPEWGMTIGTFQQKLGTDAMRNNLHRATWRLALFANIRPSSKWVITDVRFPDEAEDIRNKTGILVRVNGDPKNCRATSTRDINHISETALDTYSNFDLQYENNKSLADLEKFAKFILTKV